MTAPEPTPTAEHIDAVARQPASIVGEFIDDAALMHACRSIGTVASFNVATDLLTSTDPRVHEALAANLPADVMLAALVRAGVLTEEDAPIYRAAEHHHWQQRWDGEHTHEGRRHVTRWEVAP